MRRDQPALLGSLFSSSVARVRQFPLGAETPARPAEAGGIASTVCAGQFAATRQEGSYNR